jgi:hypothetical protein
MAGLDPAIPLSKARLCSILGIAGSSPAMTGEKLNSSHAQDRSSAVFEEGAGFSDI